MENADKATQSVIRASESVDGFVSSLQIAANSLGDTVRYVAGFTAQAASSGIVANLVLACQSAEELKKIAAHLKGISENTAAETSLKAPNKFAKQVYRYVQMRLAQTRRDSKNHWFFVYHPDTDWHPSFHKRLSKRKLGESFVGLSNQLDALVLFMLAVRDVQAKLPKTDKKPIFHLLMPAYRPFVIPDPLIFPQGLDPFCVEGQVHNSNPYVWINLPYVNPGLLKDVGVFQPQRSIWEQLARAVRLTQDPPPRILGLKVPHEGPTPSRRAAWVDIERKRFIVKYQPEVDASFAHHRLAIEEEDCLVNDQGTKSRASTKQTSWSEGSSSLRRRRRRK